MASPFDAITVTVMDTRENPVTCTTDMMAKRKMPLTVYQKQRERPLFKLIMFTLKMLFKFYQIYALNAILPIVHVIM